MKSEEFATALHIKTPANCSALKIARQRQARIGLAEADSTEDNEIASQLTESVARCADFNVTQKHLVAGAYLGRYDAVLIARYPVELPNLLTSLCSVSEVLGLTFVHDGDNGAVDVVLRFLLLNPITARVRSVLGGRVLQGVRHMERQVGRVCCKRLDRKSVV